MLSAVTQQNEMISIICSCTRAGEKSSIYHRKINESNENNHYFFLDRFKVSGYPTIKFFKKSTTPVDYNGGRTQETIVE